MIGPATASRSEPWRPRLDPAARSTHGITSVPEPRRLPEPI